MKHITLFVGDNIRTLRKERGLSQEQLALKAGMNTSYIGQVERGEKSATIDSLDKIAKALDIELEQLFRFDVNVSERKTMTVLEKINYELGGRTEKEQEEVYQFIKQLLRFRDNR
ncbi:helix-turn-helix domain-containing protein [Cohnella hongkongensis]|uniref:Helix-turn-helix domain-containing protein n=1 Tax=Cohnella hongkongensis TaxID=178337 RepID=A0ABV9F751_9BACL